MAATNELDAFFCQEELPDEFARLSSSFSPTDRPSMASMLSGIVPANQQDEVTCPLLLRRHLLIPASRHASVAGTRLHM